MNASATTGAAQEATRVIDVSRFMSAFRWRRAHRLGAAVR
jgi:hypothetical protein